VAKIQGPQRHKDTKTLSFTKNNQTVTPPIFHKISLRHFIQYKLQLLLRATVPLWFTYIKYDAKKGSRKIGIS